MVREDFYLLSGSMPECIVTPGSMVKGASCGGEEMCHHIHGSMMSLWLRLLGIHSIDNCWSLANTVVVGEVLLRHSVASVGLETKNQGTEWWELELTMSTLGCRG